MTYTIPEGEKETKEFETLEEKIRLNVGAVRLAQGKYRDCIDYCLLVQKSDPNNPKPYYRKATCHLELNEFAEAEAEIRLLESVGGAISKEDVTTLRAKLSKYVGNCSHLEVRAGPRQKDSVKGSDF